MKNQGPARFHLVIFYNVFSFQKSRRKKSRRKRQNAKRNAKIKTKKQRQNHQVKQAKKQAKIKPKSKPKNQGKNNRKTGRKDLNRAKGKSQKSEKGNRIETGQNYQRPNKQRKAKTTAFCFIPGMAFTPFGKYAIK